MVIREMLGSMIKALEGCGIDSPRFEAELLLENVGIPRITLITEPERLLSDNEQVKLQDALTRRLNGEPIQYILGKWGFFDLDFYVGDGVLIPRQDTETLVETVLESGVLCGGKLCADLCSGSGCIGITLAKHTGADVTCYELSETAFGYLKRNIILNEAGGSCSAILGDVLSEYVVQSATMFDVIVSNPPYLTAEDMNSLQREVSYEPKMALFGGDDGLDFYRELLRLWSVKLKNGGLFAVEIGMGQEKDVMSIFNQYGIPAKLKNDLCGIGRVVYGIKL